MKRGTFAGLLAASLASPRAASAQDLPVIRIGTTPIDAGAEPYFARQKGFFKSAGIAVEITALASGAALAAAVASGALDIGQSNVVSISSAHDRGIPFVLLAPASLYSYKQPQSALATAAASPLRTAKDLNGKTIAVNGLKTIAQLGPEAWIDQNGGDLASVKFIEMPFPEMENALDAHRIDAALLSEPVLSDARSRGIRVMANVYDALGKEFTIGTWFATSGWAHDHPDLVRKYIAVMKQTARWANANHAESAQILQAETQTPVSSTTTRVVFGETLDERQIQTLIDACARYGVIKTRFPAHDIIAQT
jgi:NitT/TauT family transport system substrate-binding protein